MLLHNPARDLCVLTLLCAAVVTGREAKKARSDSATPGKQNITQALAEMGAADGTQDEVGLATGGLAGTSQQSSGDQGPSTCGREVWLKRSSMRKGSTPAVPLELPDGLEHPEGEEASVVLVL